MNRPEPAMTAAAKDGIVWAWRTWDLSAPARQPGGTQAAHDAAVTAHEDLTWAGPDFMTPYTEHEAEAG